MAWARRALLTSLRVSGGRCGPRWAYRQTGSQHGSGHLRWAPRGCASAVGPNLVLATPRNMQCFPRDKFWVQM